PVKVTGKNPDDVFKLFNKLADRLDILASNSGISKVSRIQIEKEKAIPAEVYIMNGNLLDAMVRIVKSSRPNMVLGDLYKTNNVTTTKTPSDVFGLGELALRKVNIILAGNKE
ncbi:MAG: hypothetical protein HQL69_23810, partial [Magnetococcales bacterium]|nr:hypothetical protein [Magnetococcales bacterium]